MPKADLNLVSIRFFIVVVGRIVAFIVVFLFGFSLVCFALHRDSAENRAQGYAKNLVFFRNPPSRS